jgi:hypothetical protein
LPAVPFGAHGQDKFQTRLDIVLITVLWVRYCVVDKADIPN